MSTMDWRWGRFAIVMGITMVLAASPASAQRAGEEDEEDLPAASGAPFGSLFGKSSDDDGGSGGGFSFGKTFRSINPFSQTHEEFEGKLIDHVGSGLYDGPLTDPPGKKGVLAMRVSTSGVAPVKQLESYANGILNKLIAELPVKGVKARAYVIGDPKWSALATPDGGIFLSLGLLRNLESEDEVAAVLAHELAHIVRKHHGIDWFVEAQKHSVAAMEIVREVRKQVAKHQGKDKSGNFGLLTGSLIFLTVSDDALFPSWNREQEDEADLLGVDLMVAAGYNPDGMIELLDKQGEAFKDEDAAAAIDDEKLRGHLEGALLADGDIKDKMLSAFKGIGTDLLGGLRDTMRRRHRDTEPRIESIVAYLDREYEDLDAPEMDSVVYAGKIQRGTIAAVIERYKAADEAGDKAQAGDHRGAGQLLKRALSGPTAKHVYPLLVAGKSAQLAGNPAEAARRYDQASKRPGAPIEAYTSLAALYRSGNRFEDALAVLQRAKKDLDDPPQLLPDRILLHWKMKRKNQVDLLMVQCKLAGINPLYKNCKAASKGEGDAPVMPVMMASMPSQTQAAVQERFVPITPYVRVRSNKLNMRGGAGTGHSVVGSLSGGTPLWVVDRDGDWLRIQGPKGQAGWIAGWLVDGDESMDSDAFEKLRQTLVAPQSSAGATVAGAGTADPNSPAARLKRLENLYKQDLITEEEYLAKRQKIIDEL